MPQAREKFATQVNSEILAAVRQPATHTYAWLLQPFHDPVFGGRALFGCCFIVF
jgi:hypothetical protein